MERLAEIPNEDRIGDGTGQGSARISLNLNEGRVFEVYFKNTIYACRDILRCGALPLIIYPTAMQP